MVKSVIFGFHWVNTIILSGHFGPLTKNRGGTPPGGPNLGQKGGGGRIWGPKNTFGDVATVPCFWPK